MSRMLPEPVTPEPRQPVPEGVEIETRLNEGQLFHAFEAGWDAFEGAKAHRKSQNAYDAAFKSAWASYLRSKGGSGTPVASAERSGDRTGAQRQDSSSVQEGVTAVNVRELLEHASDVASESRKIIQASVDREYVTNESGIANVCRDLSTLAIHLRAANEALRQSSPRSQPVTAKEETIDERRCGVCGDVESAHGLTARHSRHHVFVRMPVTSASIEEARELVLGACRIYGDYFAAYRNTQPELVADAVKQVDEQIDALITAVRQESTS